MEQELLKVIPHDLEMLKDDMEVIKHILYEEGELSEEARERLEKARKTSFSKYKRL